MLPLTYYLLNVILCSGLLYGYYVIALRNKKFHQYNRFYLLLTVGLSIIIPLLKIQFWEETEQQPDLVKLLAVVSAAEKNAEHVTFKQTSVWHWELFASGIFSAISAIILFMLVSNLVKIFLNIRNHPKELWNNICFVFSNTKGTPYSFFKYIFWNNQIDINTNEGKHILQHELTHVHQKHSADKLFLNIVLAGGWANPFFWLIRKELNLIHEFIADQKAISDGDADAFATMLLTAAYPRHTSILTNSFFHSPIKRRLLMLTTSKLPSYSYLRRLMILPLLLIVTILFAFKVKEKVVGKIDKTFTTVINAKTIDDNRTAGILQQEEDGQKTIGQTLQDTGLKKNKRTVEVENGAKIQITDSDGSVMHVEGVTKLDIPKDTLKNSKLLVVLDGEQMSWKDFGEKNLQPEQIMQMSVLKDKYATDKYGEKGQFGVIEITTVSPNVTGSDVKLKSEQQSQQSYQYQQEKLKHQQSRQVYEQERQKQLQDQQQPQERRLSSSEQSEADVQKFDKVFTKVEQPARFPGGDEAWRRYLARNLNTKVNAPKGVYTVHVQFIVSEDGSISNVIAEVPTKCSACGQEAGKLIKKGPKWEPAVQNGRNVVYQMIQDITFNVD